MYRNYIHTRVYAYTHSYIYIGKSHTLMMYLAVDIACSPVSMNYNDDEEQWHSATETLPDLICNCSFDEHDNYVHTNKAETNIRNLEYISNNNINIINDNQILCVAYLHEMCNSQSAFQSIQTQFIWLPLNIIIKHLMGKHNAINN